MATSPRGNAAVAHAGCCCGVFDAGLGARMPAYTTPA